MAADELGRVREQRDLEWLVNQFRQLDPDNRQELVDFTEWLLATAEARRRGMSCR